MRNFVAKNNFNRSSLHKDLKNDYNRSWKLEYEDYLEIDDVKHTDDDIQPDE